MTRWPEGVTVVLVFMDFFQSGWVKGIGAVRVQLRSARARRGMLFLLRVAVLLFIAAALVSAGVVTTAGAVVIGALVVAGAVLIFWVSALAASTAWRARSAADSSVRTTVPVSARGTALRAASAASCGVTPTVVGLLRAGVVCATAPVAANDKTALANKVDRGIEKDGLFIWVLLGLKHSAVGHSRDLVCAGP